MWFKKQNMSVNEKNMKNVSLEMAIDFEIILTIKYIKINLIYKKNMFWSLNPTSFKSLEFLLEEIINATLIWIKKYFLFCHN